MECTCFNLEGEYYEEDLTMIEDATLGMMRYKIIIGKIIQKPSKGKEKGMEQHNKEAPMNLEDFDYDIP